MSNDCPTYKSVSVVIPTYNGMKLLEKYLGSVIHTLQNSTTVTDYEIILVDDASTDETVSFVHSLDYPFLSIIRNDRNSGFSITVNRGIAKAQKELTLLLNNDMELAPDFFDKTIPYFLDEKVFGINCEIRDMTGEKVLEAAKAPKRKHGEIRYEDFTPVTPCVNTYYLCGGNALVDTKKIKELGGFNELFSPFYFEDFDLSLRAQEKGWSCLYTSETFCKHCHSATIQSLPKEQVEIIFIRNRLLLNYLHSTQCQRFVFLVKLRFKQLICLIPSTSHSIQRRAIQAFFSRIVPQQ